MFTWEHTATLLDKGKDTQVVSPTTSTKRGCPLHSYNHPAGFMLGLRNISEAHAGQAAQCSTAQAWAYSN